MTKPAVPTVALIAAAIAASISLFAALLLAGSAHAHVLTTQECSEGSDFIKNAALSRDMGIDSATFIARMQDDLTVIKSFPAALRWFVQDEEDEQHLLSAVAEVFDNPRDPHEHQRLFYRQCLTRTASEGMMR